MEVRLDLLGLTKVVSDMGTLKFLQMGLFEANQNWLAYRQTHMPFEVRLYILHQSKLLPAINRWTANRNEPHSVVRETQWKNVSKSA